ncbi:hypothetical protein ACI2LO_17720 [Streptomyces sp. NPDC033754]|uniref:hypothetical protein n=1 Tax=unclassified Streptomyces TaxID=2593676 RepID=UPI0033C14674
MRCPGSRCSAGLRRVGRACRRNSSRHSVRRAAATNPSLSPEAIETLLADPCTAEGAAANPALSVPRLHTLLDHCLNGTATLPA